MNTEQMKATHAQLVFIHQIVTQRTQYFLDEVDIAKDCARTITDMANKLSDDIRALEPVKESENSAAGTPSEQDPE